MSVRSKEGTSRPLTHGGNRSNHDDGYIFNVLEQSRRHQRLSLEHILLVQRKRNQSQRAQDQRTNDSRALPWVRCSSPRQTDQEDDYPGDEEKNADKVEFFELLPLALAVHVELVIGGRVVEELVENDSDAGQDNSDVVRPAPASGGILDEETGDDWTKY